jgi:hypothetical protein
MSLLKSEPNSIFSLVKSTFIDNSADQFIYFSKMAAQLLTDAQTTATIPGGLLLVFDGTYFDKDQSRKYIAFLKAEPQTAFIREYSECISTLKLITDIFLAPKTKVYKIGLISVLSHISKDNILPNNCSYFLYDSNISNKETVKAATYFYEVFLGFNYLPSDAKITKKFMITVKSFIKELHVPKEKKIDLNSALITYIKTDQSALASIQEFSEKYIDNPLYRDSLLDYAQKNNLITHAFTKDLSESIKLLKHRIIHFAGDIKLIAPSDKFNNTITINKVMQENGEIWSQITIKDILLGD